MDIAEWIADFLILGIALLIWVIAIFGCCLLFNMCKKVVDNFLEDGMPAWFKK